jgi:hypothetical protein
MAAGLGDAVKRKVKEGLSIGLWTLGLLINGSLAFLLFWYAVFAWVLKDGLGPNSVESIGLKAWRRWGEGMGEAALPALFILGIGCLCCWLGHRLELQPEEAK